MALIGNVAMYRIFTGAFDEICDFYKDTLEFPVEYADDNIAIFQTGACKIGIEPTSADKNPSKGGFTGLSFETEDIVLALETLRKKGVEIVGKPAKQYWGGTLAHFNDPEGRTFTLVEYPKTSS